jgi:two-component system sensor histidine kinase NreB
MMEQVNKLVRALAEYSDGNFDFQTPLEDSDDLLNSLLNGLNMLGEELKEKTISRDYFNAIYNSVTDMIFILSPNGWILDCNQSALIQMGYEKEELAGKLFDQFQPDHARLYLDKCKGSLTKGQVIQKLSVVTAANQDEIPVQLKIIRFFFSGETPERLLLTMRDRRGELQAERKIRRTIIDTQEAEKKRIAQDLHDAVGQQVTGIQLYINTAIAEADNPRLKEVLQVASSALAQLSTEMHRACFQLMPPTLEAFGLRQAVHDLCAQGVYYGNLRFDIEWSPLFPPIPKSTQIDLYRVIQEFLGNALKHGEATVVKMSFQLFGAKARVILTDNGKGFLVKKKKYTGMGLRNIRTRINSLGGRITIASAPGKGTAFDVFIPL